MNGLLAILNHIGLVLEQANARISQLETELSAANAELAEHAQQNATPPTA